MAILGRKFGCSLSERQNKKNYVQTDNRQEDRKY